MKPYPFYSNLFTLQGTRNRLSFIGATLVISVLLIVITMAYMVFAPQTLMSMAWTYILLAIVLVVAVIPVIIQRLRSMLGDNTFYIIVVFLLMMIIPFVNLLLLVWPPKK